MKEAGSGHIVAVSSIQGRLSQAYRSACKYRYVVSNRIKLYT